jgi:mevalonate kinase
MIKDALFHAKILLFGEYGIIQDSMGLSIPYKAYRGELTFKESVDGKDVWSNEQLRNYLVYLKELQEKKELLLSLDLDSMKLDIENGMVFDSTIPNGYGVGSSGALVAAIYDKYAHEAIVPEDDLNKTELLELKEGLAQMESHFHGKSSGIDPLICYMKLPILIKSKDELGTIGLPQEGKGEGAIFLINSGQPGETQNMVNIFMERMKQEGFRNMVRKEFTKYNDECISAFLDGETQPFFESLKGLSDLVLKHFSPMIPMPLRNFWLKGLNTDDYYLKLCGSGGGGYVLGFTQNLEQAKKQLKGKDLEVIYRF